MLPRLLQKIHEPKLRHQLPVAHQGMCMPFGTEGPNQSLFNFAWTTESSASCCNRSTWAAPLRYSQLTRGWFFGRWRGVDGIFNLCTVQIYSFRVRADQSICARERHKRISRTERGAERQIGRAVSQEATSKWQKSGEASISIALALARAHVLKKKNMRPAVATNTSQRSRQASCIETSKGFWTFVSVDITIYYYI